MTVTGLPFDDFRALLRDLPGPDTAALVAARERDRQLTKPAGALGRLEEIAFWLAAWTARAKKAAMSGLAFSTSISASVAAEGRAIRTPASGKARTPRDKRPS